MTCHEYQELLSAYADRALHIEEQTAVARHLDDCDACRRELQATLTLKEHLRAQTMPRLPRHVIAAIEAETIFKANILGQWRSWWMPALTLTAALGAWTFTHLHKPAAPGTPLNLPVAQRPSAPAEKEQLLVMHRSTPSVSDLQ